MTRDSLFLSATLHCLTGIADSLLQNADDVEVVLIEQYALLLQVVRNDAFLLADGLAARVYLLKEHLHEIGLADG